MGALLLGSCCSGRGGCPLLLGGACGGAAGPVNASPAEMSQFEAAIGACASEVFLGRCFRRAAGGRLHIAWGFSSSSSLPSACLGGKYRSQSGPEVVQLPLSSGSRLRSPLREGKGQGLLGETSERNFPSTSPPPLLVPGGQNRSPCAPLGGSWLCAAGMLASPVLQTLL